MLLLITYSILQESHQTLCLPLGNGRYRPKGWISDVSSTEWTLAGIYFYAPFMSPSAMNTLIIYITIFFKNEFFITRMFGAPLYRL